MNEEKRAAVLARLEPPHELLKMADKIEMLEPGCPRGYLLDGDQWRATRLYRRSVKPYRLQGPTGITTRHSSAASVVLCWMG